MKPPYTSVMVLDMETAWCSKTGFTLSKMTTEEYIRDPRFKAWGLCYKLLGEEGEAVWVRGSQIAEWVKKVDWTTTAVLAHNAVFDCGILSFIYGIKPCFYFDSLSMARALRGVEVGNSLAKLAEVFGLPPKGKAVHSTDGMLDKLPFDVEAELADYCRHDVFLCESIFNCLVQGFNGVGEAVDVYSGPYPAKELRLIDMTIRMFTNPVLELDAPLLQKEVSAEKERREKLLTRLGVGDKELASNEQFAQILRGYAIEPPMKLSPTTGKPVYAFAKTDAMFQALQSDDNEEVADLCEARLLVKSTIERTRGERFLGIAKRGTLPVPLNYYGAHTGRWAARGGEAINLQNLGRKSFLRDAIHAPKGHVLVVVDLAQIEPRVLAWLADYKGVLDMFASGQDVYALFGAEMFGVPGLNKKDHPELRQSAKAALLACGYGQGFAAFSAKLLAGFLGAPPVLYDKAFAKKLGVTAEDINDFLHAHDGELVTRMNEIPHRCTDQELLVHCVATKMIVDKYRRAASPVVDFWKLNEELLPRSLAGGVESTYKFLTFAHERIILPNGMSLRYPGLEGKPDPEKRGRVEWTYGKGKRIYAPKLVENEVQAVARCVMTDGLLRIQERYFVAHSAHDEGTAIVPEREADEAKQWIREQMVVQPKWMPGIPLDAEVGVGHTYREAKS